MRKHLFFLCACFLLAQSSWAIDQSYYSTINNKSGSTLRDNLYTITCAGPTGMSYDGLWDAYKTSDVYPADSVGKAGKIWDMYSNVLWTPGQKQCGNYSNVGSCYNREHSVPKSWFNEKKPAYYDLGHIIPTDGYVNNQRGNNPIGECEGGTRLKNGSYVATGRSGSSTFSGYTSIGTVFEPDDQYKGDFARMYMYMAVRYKKGNKDDVSISSEMYNTTDANYGFTAYSVALLMKWHRMDPVSRKEIDRNNGMQSEQGNRNPFVDYPILAEYLWGTKTNETFSFDVATGSFEDDFIPGVSDGSNTNAARLTSPSGTIDCGATNTTDAVYKQITIQGENLENGNLTLAISGTNASFFKLATATVTKAQAEAGYSVTLTYAPTSDGNHTATLTITGCGITARTVQLTGKCTTVHTVTWIDAENTQTTKVENNGALVLPTNTPADCSTSRVFVGWTAQTSVSGTAPTDLFTTPTATINAPKTYYAVYADATTSGSGSTGSVTITTSTTNIPTSYGTANTFTEYTLEGYQFKIQQMYLNSGKLQWRAAGNSSGTGTMYNTSTFPGKLSSIVLTYNSSDNNKNFTLKVGSSQNPTDGTSITPTSSGSVYTFDCSDQNADYFVLTNGSGAGYLDQIVINYSGSSTTYSNYSLECTACTPVTPTASFVSPTTSLEEGATVTNTVTTASNGVVTYSSNNTSVATVDASTGEVTGVAAGTATITASIAATACYNATSASYTITVEAAPEYTVTFINNGATFFSQTGHAGDAISGLGTPSLTDCDDYTFEGWSTSQYVEDNTSSPAIITPTTIPTGGATYYAVYTKSVTEGGSGGGGSSTANVSMESLAAASGIVGNYEFSTAKNNGSTPPTYNTNGKDLRIYAKGSVTISSSTAMTGIVFNLSSQGKKRLAPITASTGTIATQASGDEIVTWTGSATSVTFTVGDNADYGSESSKAGQLCFLSVDITTGSGSGGTTTTYHTTAPNCSCEVTITITSADETMGTVEFVE